TEVLIGAAERKRAGLAAVHERVAETLESRRAQTVHAGARAVVEAAALAAPTAAGAPWDAWIPYPALGKGPAPLLRVGVLDDGPAEEGAPALPALVALLDRDHLRVTADAAGALTGLLLRTVGAVPAGAV